MGEKLWPGIYGYRRTRAGPTVRVFISRYPVILSVKDARKLGQEILDEADKAEKG